jgi:hypothetical protein
MEVVAISTRQLIALANKLRNLKQVSARDRTAAVEVLLESAGILRRADTEHLCCLKCAALSSDRVESTIYRMGEDGRLTVFTICHKDYFDKREVAQLVDPADVPRRRKKKVS